MSAPTLSKRQEYELRKKEREAKLHYYASLDLTKEVQDVLATGTARSYERSLLSGPQRKALSLEAERCGLAAYTDVLLLVIGPGQHLAIDTDVLLDYFSKVTKRQFNPKTFLQDVKMYGLEQELELCKDDVSKYGLAGARRRDEILTQHLEAVIKSREAYARLQSLELPDLSTDDRDIADHVYEADHPPDSAFISIDVRASIFKAYRDQGVIQEVTWEEFIGKFTTSKWVTCNKTLRLILFGKLCVQKHAALIRGTIEPVVQNLKADPYWSAKIAAIAGDEIVLRTSLGEWEGDVRALKAMDLGWEDLRMNCYRLQPWSWFVQRIFLFPAAGWDVKCAPTDRLRDAYLSVIENKPEEEKIEVVAADSQRPLRIYTWGLGTRNSEMPPDSECNFDASEIRYNRKGLKLDRMTGMDEEIRSVVMAAPQSKKMLRRIISSVEKNNYSIISINCRHGRHRSVSLANHLLREYYPNGYAIHLCLHQMVRFSKDAFLC